MKRWSPLELALAIVLVVLELTIRPRRAIRAWWIDRFG